MISKLKAVLDDDRGVSPVIGVILMVAITVILAAVIGTFVLGLGDSLEQAPQAQIAVEYDSGSSNILVSHDGGDTIPVGELDIIIDGGASSDFSSNAANTYDNSEFAVGDTANFAGGEGDTVRIIHAPSDSIIVDTTV